MKRWLQAMGLTGAVLLLLIVGGALRQMWGAAPQNGPARIAVVNLSRVWKESRRRADLEEKLTLLQRTIQENFKDQQDEIDRLKAKIDLLASGSAERKQAEQDLALKVAQKQVFEKSSRQQVASELLSYWDVVFNDIEEAVGTVARQDGYDLVFKTVETPEHSTNVAEFRSKEQQVLLYSTPTLDVTEKVIGLLNRKYTAKE